MKAKRLLSWPRAERHLLLRAWLLLWVCDLGVRLVRLDRLTRLMTMANPRRLRRGGPTPERLAAIVDTAARHHLPAMSCLRRALVLLRLLDARGFRPVLKVGAHLAGGELRAHAWIEVEGQPVGQPRDVYDRFPPLQPSGARLGGERREPASRLRPQQFGVPQEIMAGPVASSDIF